jgi:hypothetical protein
MTKYKVEVYAVGRGENYDSNNKYDDRYTMFPMR